MIRMTSIEFQRRFGHAEHLATAAPIIITEGGKDRLVLMSAEEYERLKRRETAVRPNSYTN